MPQTFSSRLAARQTAERSLRDHHETTRARLRRELDENDRQLKEGLALEAATFNEWEAEQNAELAAVITGKGPLRGFLPGLEGSYEDLHSIAASFNGNPRQSAIRLQNVWKALDAKCLDELGANLAQAHLAFAFDTRTAAPGFMGRDTVMAKVGALAKAIREEGPAAVQIAVLNLEAQLETFARYAQPSEAQVDIMRRCCTDRAIAAERQRVAAEENAAKREKDVAAADEAAAKRPRPDRAATTWPQTPRAMNELAGRTESADFDFRRAYGRGRS